MLWSDRGARHDLARPTERPGAWYVDIRCIDRGASRTVAPGLIVEGGNQSMFARQPEKADEFIKAWRARLLCPTAVHTERQADVPHGVFPEEMTQDVYRLGYNAKAAYGAHSFAIRRSAGNAIVDAPRWTRAAVEQFEAGDGLTATWKRSRIIAGIPGRNSSSRCSGSRNIASNGCLRDTAEATIFRPTK